MICVVFLTNVHELVIKMNVRLMVPDILKDSNIFIENNPAIPVCREIFAH